MPRSTSYRVLVSCLTALLVGGLVASSPAAAQSQCSFKGKLKISPRNIMSDSDPVLGNPSADVLLIEFFDPNCHHCRRIHSVMKDVMKKYGDRVKFYMHPIPAWRYSIRQIEALLLAKEKGKYYEMIDQQLENQQKRGLSVDQIAAMADSIGIDPSWMRDRLKRQAVRKQVGRRSYQAQKAGVKNAPTLAIGRKIISSSQPTSCIGRLIERTLKNRKAAGE